jgi:hypothetical protein
MVPLPTARGLAPAAFPQHLASERLQSTDCTGSQDSVMTQVQLPFHQMPTNETSPGKALRRVASHPKTMTAVAVQEHGAHCQQYKASTLTALFQPAVRSGFSLVCKRRQRMYAQRLRSKQTKAPKRGRTQSARMLKRMAHTASVVKMLSRAHPWSFPTSCLSISHPTTDPSHNCELSLLIWTVGGFPGHSFRTFTSRSKQGSSSSESNLPLSLARELEYPLLSICILLLDGFLLLPKASSMGSSLGMTGHGGG